MNEPTDDFWSAEATILDPDYADVPFPLLGLDGSGDAFGAGVIVVVPGLFGHARRLREAFYDDIEPA